jgi:hypothetical protein
MRCGTERGSSTEFRLPKARKASRSFQRAAEGLCISRFVAKDEAGVSLGGDRGEVYRWATTVR